ncbi:MerR family DNA-binding transcriptional regulator [Virgibacillus sp. Bac330]|uniref:MerR family DNA-binding transcriptional regulator n=1 Tax=Virgibacillus sp. Bac330 TaxID=2419841 RepID=UPI000EF47A2E|nr:MerR family transcriptional regulator [Virgibacillus sp. Bac330]
MKHTYSVGEVAKLLQISIHTIRYYEKVGLLPKIERLENGYRYFDTESILRLKGIVLLRACGMSIDNILKIHQDNSIENNLNLMLDTSKMLESHIAELQNKKRELDEAIIASEEFHTTSSSSIVKEKITGWFTPYFNNEISLPDFLEDDDTAWLLRDEEFVMGKMNASQESEDSLSLKDQIYLCCYFSFNNEEAIEQALKKLLAYAANKKYNTKDYALLTVLSKPSISLGHHLAGRLMLALHN